MRKKFPVVKEQFIPITPEQGYAALELGAPIGAIVPHPSRVCRQVAMNFISIDSEEDLDSYLRTCGFQCPCVYLDPEEFDPQNPGRILNDIKKIERKSHQTFRDRVDRQLLDIFYIVASGDLDRLSEYDDSPWREENQ